MAKILTLSNLTFQTTCPVFALQSASWLDALGLIQCFHHSRFHLSLWHLIGSYYPCHQNLPPQGLRVCHAISHYNGNALATIVHLCVSVLYCQTLWQPSLIRMQGLSLHISLCTCECSFHPHIYNSGQEGIYHLTILGGNYFIILHTQPCHLLPWW